MAKDILKGITDKLALLWQDRCTVTMKEAYQKPNGATAFRDKIILEDAPCKLSYFVSRTHDNTAVLQDEAAPIHRRVRIFLTPDVDISAGSRISVTREGKTTQYKASGESARHFSHQEIIMELADEWA